MPFSLPFQLVNFNYLILNSPKVTFSKWPKKHTQKTNKQKTIQNPIRTKHASCNHMQRLLMMHVILRAGRENKHVKWTFGSSGLSAERGVLFPYKQSLTPLKEEKRKYKSQNQNTVLTENKKSKCPAQQMHTAEIYQNNSSKIHHTTLWNQLSVQMHRLQLQLKMGLKCMRTTRKATDVLYRWQQS